MIAFFRALISLCITIAAILFALGNQQKVLLSWSPVNDPITLPVFAIGLGGAFIGLIAGALLIWLQSLRLRMQLHRERHHIKTLEKELETLRSQTAIPRVSVPVLPQAAIPASMAYGEDD
jgi:O-antigen/teichoic acid export membrane protein